VLPHPDSGGWIGGWEIEKEGGKEREREKEGRREKCEIATASRSRSDPQTPKPRPETPDPKPQTLNTHPPPPQPSPSPPLKQWIYKTKLNRLGTRVLPKEDPAKPPYFGAPVHPPTRVEGVGCRV
jgi:hypothetical protein